MLKKTKKINNLEENILELKQAVNNLSRTNDNDNRNLKQELNKKLIQTNLITDKTLENHKENIEKLIRKTNVLQAMLFMLIFVTAFLITYYFFEEEKNKK